MSTEPRLGSEPAADGEIELAGTDTWLAIRTASEQFQSAAMSSNTRRAYRSDWRHFERWCRMHRLEPMPAQPETVVAYISALAILTNPTAGKKWTYSPTTLVRRLAAIGKAHHLAGHPSPCDHPAVLTTMDGIRRERRQPVRRVAPLVLSDLKALLAAIDGEHYPAAVAGRRDAALVLFGFVGAFRRSELVALVVDDVTVHAEDGLHVRMRHSKTDQAGRGAVKALPYGRNPQTCPPCAFRLWMRVMKAASGGRAAVMREVLAPRPEGHVCRSDPHRSDLPCDMPLFPAIHKTGVIGARAMTGHAVNLLLKRRLAAAGYDPTDWGGHSMRAGFVTQALRDGADYAEVMRQTGQTKVETVEVYRREATPLIGNAASRLAL